LLQRQKLGQLPGTGFPDSRGIAKITMLLEKSEAQTRLTSDASFRWLMIAGYQPEERSFPAAVATNDSPALATCNRESYVVKDPRCAEFNGGIRDGNLGQERSTLEQAARQRSMV
jgi:hypothetical protein